MSASSYIGRVGGLAVAFGVGTALLTGYGVASADSTSSGSDSSSSSPASSDGGGSSDSSGSDAQESAGSDSSASAADDAAADSAAEDAAAEEAAAEEAAADAAAEEAAAEEAAAEEAAADAAAEEAAAEEAAEEEAAADAAAEEAAAEEAAAEEEADSSASGDVPVIKSAAVATPVLDVVDDVVNPADVPAAPPAGAPLEAAAAAAARRELLIGGGPITVAPTVTFTEGVIYGNVNASPNPATDYTYTLTSDPSNGGKIFLGTTDPTDPTKTIQDGSFNYLPFQDEDAPAGTFEAEQFTIMVSELSGLMQLLEKIPLLGDFVAPTVLALQQTPFIGGLLQPIIGYRTFAEFDVDAGELAMDLPVAFTTKVTSFDGVQISTNWFPSITVDEADDQAPTVLNGPGLGANGSINPTAVIGTLGFVPGISLIRDVPESPLDFNYVSWDPRGEGASDGFLQLDNPFFEGRDTQHIIDYIATLPWTTLSTDGMGDPIAGDPQVGMVGGSYGGGIQWVEAGIDRRVDAIVPAASWNSLNESLYPTDDFKTSWALLLGLDLVEAGARVNSEIYPAIVRGTLFGTLSESEQAILSSSGPTVLVDSITAPSLIIQGTADGLFPLNQSIINAGILDANDIDVKMIWACGGHGVCLNPGDATAQFENLADRTLTWLTSYLYLDGGLPTGEVFEWYDQNGDLKSSNLLPSDPAFYGVPLERGGGGGSLFLQPLCCGGSGPQLKAVDAVGPEGLLVSPALAAPARDAINIDIPGPALLTQDVVGAPKLTLTYSGLGTSRHVYAQLIDNNTDLVLGNIITPIPVILDGQTHVKEIDLESIAYTMSPSDSLTLQIVGATSVYADATQWGFINVTDALLSLPTVA